MAAGFSNGTRTTSGSIFVTFNGTSLLVGVAAAPRTKHRFGRHFSIPRPKSRFTPPCHADSSVTYTVLRGASIRDRTAHMLCSGGLDAAPPQQENQISAV